MLFAAEFRTSPRPAANGVASERGENFRIAPESKTVIIINSAVIENYVLDVFE